MRKEKRCRKNLVIMAKSRKVSVSNTPINLQHVTQSHELLLFPGKSFTERHNYLGLSEELCGTTLPSFNEQMEDPKAGDVTLRITLAAIKSPVAVVRIETVLELLSN